MIFFQIFLKIQNIFLSMSKEKLFFLFIVEKTTINYSFILIAWLIFFYLCTRCYFYWIQNKNTILETNS
jgi:hypothetical protein